MSHPSPIAARAASSPDETAPDAPACDHCTGPAAHPALRDALVVKIGGSVLRGPADAATAASEIYRLRRAGAPVVAVVSAINGHTDVLLHEARAFGEADSVHAPRLIALGEHRSAALTAMACERVGLRAAVLGPEALALRAEGDRAAAAPSTMDAGVLTAALARHDVVIVPGFVAQNAQGEPVLLGRGGSDMTAVFIAAQAGLDHVRLIKDVDGVYDRDPAVAGGEARRFDDLGYAQARAVAGDVVQDRAIAFAERCGVAIHVAAVGASSDGGGGPRGRVTRIGDRHAPPRPVQPPQRLRVAVCGAGVVGGGVLAQIARRPDLFALCAVLVRDRAKPRDAAMDPALLVTDLEAVFAAQPDIVIEATSSGAAGVAILERALSAGVHVVSANKQAVVTDLPGLTACAAQSGARLRYAAAVGGGTPMIETIRAARAAGDIMSFEAVLNGTVNFILDRMAEGAAFDAALEEARLAGFAEEDPSADLDGRDAAAKVRILAYEAFAAALSDHDAPAAPLDMTARAQVVQGGAWKQIGVCRRTAKGLAAAVRLTDGDDAAAFATATRERNALRVTLTDGRVFTAEGRGAGRWPTAESMFADLMDLRAELLAL